MNLKLFRNICFILVPTNNINIEMLIRLYCRNVFGRWLNRQLGFSDFCRTSKTNFKEYNLAVTKCNFYKSVWLRFFNLIQVITSWKVWKKDDFVTKTYENAPAIAFLPRRKTGRGGKVAVADELDVSVAVNTLGHLTTDRDRITKEEPNTPPSVNISFIVFFCF